MANRTHNFQDGMKSCSFFTLASLILGGPFADPLKTRETVQRSAFSKWESTYVASTFNINKTATLTTKRPLPPSWITMKAAIVATLVASA